MPVRGTKYCLLLNRMKLTYTTCVEPLDTGEDGRGSICKSCQNYECLSLHDLYTLRHLLGSQLA